MTIPNQLSIFRIVLIPVFIVIFFLFPENGLWAALILLISGATDVLDGWIARTFNQISQLGKWLDPFADKLTQVTVSICLAIRHKEFIIILCLLVAKEIIMLTAGIYFYRKKVKIPSSKWFGKVFTVVFYLVMAYIIFDVKISVLWLNILGWTLVAFAVLAFVRYVPVGLKLYRGMKDHVA